MRSVLSLILSFTLAAAAGACPPLPADAAGRLGADEVAARVPLCHPDVLAAERALQASQADVLSAGQRPNPQLSLGAASLGRDLRRRGLWDKPFDHQVRVDQLVERGDKPALRVATAQALRDAARADLAEAQRQALRATLGFYFDLAAAVGRVEALDASVRLLDESLQALQRRVRAGDAAPLDASRLQVDALRVRADLLQAQAEQQGLQQSLALAVGAPQAAVLLRPRLDPAEAAPAPEPVPVDQRPALAAAQARLTSALRARDLALAQRTRDVGVGLQADRYPTTPANGSGNGNTLSVFVSLPLFVRHAFEGDIARAEADVDAAELALRSTRAQAEDEAARAQAAWQAAQARQRLVLDDLLPAAERVAAGAELAYRRGASSVLELLDARRALRAAQLERVAADADAAKARAGLQSLAATAP